MLESHRHQLLDHSQSLGLPINAKKNALQPWESIAFLGAEPRFTCNASHLSQVHAQSPRHIQARRYVSLKCFQRSLGMMAAAAVVCRLGLLQGDQRHVMVTRICMRTLTPLAGQDHVRARGYHGQSGQKKSHDDGCLMDRLGSRLAYSTWTSAQSKWHIFFFELKAVSLALQHLCPFLKARHVLIQMDNWAAVSYINHQGGIPSRRLQMLILMGRQVLSDDTSSPRSEAEQSTESGVCLIRQSN